MNKQEKIDEDLNIILQGIRRIIPEPLAVILTGGFGRDEGSMFKSGNEWKAINDYDLFVVVKKKKLQQQKRLQLQATKLAESIGIDYVDVALVTEKQLQNWPHTMLHQDVKEGSKIFYGDENILSKIPQYPSVPPLSEAMILLGNRCAGVLGGRWKPKEYRINQDMKLLLAIADATNILHNSYATKYQEKFQLYKKNSKELLPLIEKAFSFKKKPSYSREFTQKQKEKIYLQAKKVFKLLLEEPAAKKFFFMPDLITYGLQKGKLLLRGIIPKKYFINYANSVRLLCVYQLADSGQAKKLGKQYFFNLNTNNLSKVWGVLCH